MTHNNKKLKSFGKNLKGVWISALTHSLLLLAKLWESSLRRHWVACVSVFFRVPLEERWDFFFFLDNKWLTGTDKGVHSD